MPSYISGLDLCYEKVYLVLVMSTHKHNWNVKDPKEGRETNYGSFPSAGCIISRFSGTDEQLKMPGPEVMVHS